MSLIENGGHLTLLWRCEVYIIGCLALCLTFPGYLLGIPR